MEPSHTSQPTCVTPAEHLHVARSRRSLRGNKLGDKGWTALFKALCENKGDKIESWDLSDEGVGPETAQALAEYISVSTTLTSLKYVGPQTNPLTCAYLHAIAP